MGNWRENFWTAFDLADPDCTRDLDDFSEKYTSDAAAAKAFPVEACAVATPAPAPAPTAGPPTCPAGAVDDATAAPYEMMMGCGGVRCPVAAALWDDVNMRMRRATWDLKTRRRRGLSESSRRSRGVTATRLRGLSARRHEGMAISYTGDASLDFVRGMIPHHQGAMDMCDLLIDELECVEREVLSNLDGLVMFCQEVHYTQERELAGMRAWLARRNASEHAPCDDDDDGHSMDMPSDDHSMHSMGTDDHSGHSMGTDDHPDHSSTMTGHEHSVSYGCGALETNSSRRFVAANEEMHDGMAVEVSCDHTTDFVRMMVPHHAGAVRMCQVLSDASPDAYLVDLCQNTTRLQCAPVSVAATPRPRRRRLSATADCLHRYAEIAWLRYWLDGRDVSSVAPCYDCDDDEGAAEPELPCEDMLSTSLLCALARTGVNAFHDVYLVAAASPRLSPRLRRGDAAAESTAALGPPTIHVGSRGVVATRDDDAWRRRRAPAQARSPLYCDCAVHTQTFACDAVQNETQRAASENCARTCGACPARPPLFHDACPSGNATVRVDHGAHTDAYSSNAGAVGASWASALLLWLLYLEVSLCL